MFGNSENEGLQVAKQLELSEQTVKNYLTSALKILRSEIMKYNILFIFFL